MLKENIKILAFVGLAGSGKSTAADYIASKGYPKVYFGGVVLDLMSQQGIDHTANNEKIFRESLREKEGIGFVGETVAKQIRNLINSGQHKVVADGLYSWTEYKALKKEFPGELIVVAIVANKRLRHRRLLSRPIRPLSQEEVDHRDWDEIENLEKGGPIAIADHYIINDGNIEDLNQKVDQLLKDTNFLK